MVNLYCRIEKKQRLDCSFKIFFAANDHKTAEYISNLSIDKNEKKELLSWQEVMTLSQDLQIILPDKEQPIICKKMKYYDYEKMKARIIDAAKFSF